MVYVLVSLSDLYVKMSVIYKMHRTAYVIPEVNIDAELLLALASFSWLLGMASIIELKLYLLKVEKSFV